MDTTNTKSKMTDEKTPPVATPDEKPEEAKEPEKAPEEKQEETSPLLDETKKTVEDLNKATAGMKKEREKMEKVSSDLMLQGKGLMSGSKTETEDEKWEREAKERYAGTGLDPTPDNTPITYR